MLVRGLDGNPHFPQFQEIMGWNLGEEAFQRAGLRILFVFPSGMGVRSVSATHVCLYNIVKNHFGDDVFVDIWMKPYPWDNSYMNKNFPQNIIGFFSHHTYDDFDIVGLSLAITSYEFVEVANVFRDTGIPLWSEERLNDDSQPLIVGGGIAQDNTVILDRVQDLVMLGLGERNLIRLIDIAFQVQAECGSVKKGKTTIISRAQMLTGFYNPKNYHYSWNVVNGHVECKYESCDVPELQRIKADIALPAEVIASGTNNVLKLSTPGGHHKVSLQSAFACHGLQGSCFFSFAKDTLFRSNLGLKRLSELKVGDLILAPDGTYRTIEKLFPSLPDYQPCYRFTLANGQEFTVSHHHDLADENLKLKWSENFRVGDKVNLSYYQPGFGKEVSNPVMWLAGFATGDGWLGKGKNSYHICLCLGWKHPDFLAELNAIRNYLDLLGAKYREDSTQETELRIYVSGQVAKDIRAWVLKEDVTSLTQLDYASFLSWFAGYVQADGTIEKVGRTVNCCSSNRGFIVSLQKTLAYFGIPSRYDVSVYKQSTSANPRFAKYAGRVIEKHRLSLNRYYTNILFYQSGLLLGRKDERLCPGKRDKEVSATQIKKFATIVSIEELPPQEVCNLSVSGDHLVTIEGNIASYQCHEAWLYGAWRESSPEALKKGIYEAKKSSMGEGFGYFAFNANFNTNYVDSLQWAAEYFNKIGTINIRQDSLAGSIKLGGENNYIRLLKELGTTSIAAPIEGISQRLRNWLNKNLTVEDILTVSEEVFKRRMIRFKNGVIVTCYETKEDYEEHRELIIKQQELRDKWGANTQQQVNGTYLVHNYATPLYYLPRKSTALAWKQFFSKVDGKDFYFYPWMYMSDLGVKYKESSQPTDTIVQQTLQDLPCELLEEFYLKPVYERRFENMSKEMVINLRKGFEKYGIKPKAQFLEYDAYKHPRQHMDIGQAEVLIKRYGSYDKLLEYTNSHDGTGCCLKTPGTEWKEGTLMNCKGCNYCPDIDKTRKEMGFEVTQPHAKWMHSRPLNINYNIMDVKTSLLKNTPSFYYRLIFKVTEPGRYIAKEALVRRWLSKATDYDETLVKNFRTISTALHKWLDYEGLTSTYTGYELCIMGFQSQLDLDKFKDLARQVNTESKDSGIQLADIQTAQESGGTSFYVLHSFEVIAEKEDFDKFIKKMCTEERRLYEGSTSMPETFAMSIDYKILRGKKGYRVLVLCPPRFNIMWSEGLKKWTAPRVFDHIVDWTIMAIFTKTPDGRFISILDGKPFETSGFVHAEQSGAEFAGKEDEAPEMDGA